MEFFLNIMIGWAIGAAGAYFAIRTIAAVKELRAKGRQSAAEARLMDEIGRKLAGGDATMIPVGHACNDPECPAHGKDGGL